MKQPSRREFELALIWIYMIHDVCISAETAWTVLCTSCNMPALGHSMSCVGWLLTWFEGQCKALLAKAGESQNTEPLTTEQCSVNHNRR